MRIDTRSFGFSLTPAIASHVDDRIGGALEPFAHSLLGVTVRLDDVNATRGGVDKRCTVVAAVRRHGVECAHAIHGDLYAAIDEAAKRIRRSVQRVLKQHLTRERSDRQRPGALIAA